MVNVYMRLHVKAKGKSEIRNIGIVRRLESEVYKAIPNEFLWILDYWLWHGSWKFPGSVPTGVLLLDLMSSP